MSMNTSQDFESYVPVYDAIPEKWEDSRPFIVEMLRKLSNAVNVRGIGYNLDEEVLTGNQFIPSPNNPQQFRNIFRKVIDVSPLVAGANSFPHDLTFDDNFTLVDMWVAATDNSGFTAINMSDPQNVDLDITNININSPANYDRAFATIEYLLEV